MFLTCCVAVTMSGKTAEEAWNELVGPKFLEQSAFACVIPDPGLPNVLIYGDSISIHYTPALRKQLEGKANVFRLHCNGGDSSTVIEKLTLLHETMRDEALEGHWSFDWDVIQFNVGLHDLKYWSENGLDRENGKQVSTIEAYQKNLKGIIAYLKKLAPEATLIFATTTPVPENSAGRVAGDAVRYNQAALAVLKEYPEVLINDLYAFTKPKQPEWWAHPGNVHYNKEGCEAQGAEVATFILDVLK